MGYISLRMLDTSLICWNPSKYPGILSGFKLTFTDCKSLFNPKSTCEMDQLVLERRRQKSIPELAICLLQMESHHSLLRGPTANPLQSVGNPQTTIRRYLLCSYLGSPITRYLSGMFKNHTEGRERLSYFVRQLYCTSNRALGPLIF